MGNYLCVIGLHKRKLHDDITPLNANGIVTRWQTWKECTRCHEKWIISDISWDAMTGLPIGDKLLD